MDPFEWSWGLLWISQDLEAHSAIGSQSHDLFWGTVAAPGRSELSLERQQPASESSMFLSFYLGEAAYGD